MLLPRARAFGAGGSGPISGPAQRGLGFCPGGADLPRHHPGQPRLRLALRLGASGSRDGTAPAWQAVVDRADSAPADIVPGLLASTFEASGVGVRVGVGASCTFSAPRTSDGQRRSIEKVKRSPPPGPPTPTLEVRSCEPRDAVVPDARTARRRPADRRRETARRPDNEALAIGIAGKGFDGNLTSDSTRLDGYVLSTDVAPTILDRFGIAVPSRDVGAGRSAARARSIRGRSNRSASGWRRSPIGAAP